MRTKLKDQIANKTILVTGAAGFIGSFLCNKLINSIPDVQVIGLDNLNDYYDPALKIERLKMISRSAIGRDSTVDPNGFSVGNFVFIKGDLANHKEIDNVFKNYKPDIVINLAAQAGVRYSIENPRSYIDSNLIGFFNILEACREYPVDHLVYASSSSVYGNSSDIPFSENDKVDNPVSLYAATKKSDELLAYAYSCLYDIPATGLRFFTVYGPMGRPDMAYFSFARKMCSGESIEVFNYGNCKRDFTFIDDIVEGIIKLIDLPFESALEDTDLILVKHRIYNIGNSDPVNLLEFLDTLQQSLFNVGLLPENYNNEANRTLLPMQPGDVVETYADTSKLEQDTGFKPTTSLSDGLSQFAQWFKKYMQQSIDT